MVRNFLFLLIVILAACNQETIIGNQLITDQVVDIQFTDEIELSARSIEGDSLVIFTTDGNVSNNPSLMLMGQSQDQLFGNAQSTTFFTINLNTVDTLQQTDFIDSIVLTIPLDTLASYSNDNAIHHFELFELTESMYDLDTIRTDDFFDFDPTIVGQRSFVPDTRDSIRAYEASLDSMINFRAHIRIPIENMDFRSKLINSAKEANGDDDLFREDVLGFALRSSTDESSFVSLNMGNSLASITEVNVYYTEGGEKQIYSFPVGGRRSVAFTHELTGSDAGMAINDQSFADSLLYIQGMRGPNIEVDLSAIKNLTKGSINYAQLEFNVATTIDDEFGIHPAITRIGAFYEDDSGILQQVRDLSIGDSGLNFIDYFDGNLEEGMDTMRYNMTLTSHSIDILNETITNDKIILIPFNKQVFANRAVIFGPGNSESPMKLKIVQTNP